MRHVRSTVCVVVAILIVVQASCTSQPKGKPVPEGKVLLRGAGATFPNPLYQKWAEEYGKEQEAVVVEYASVGSGKGIEKFLEDSVDFGASDRALSDEQIGQAKRGALLVPTTAGMVVVAYNAEGLPKMLRLKRDVYADIFHGKITKWNDPRIQETNPDYKFPSKQISIVVRQDKSGTTFAFTNHLSAISKDWKAGPGVGTGIQWPTATLPAPGNEGVVAMIQRTPYAIGYAEYGQAKRLHLRMAELENKAGKFIAPVGGAGLEALLAVKVPDNFRVFVPDPEGEHSYPIITYTWIMAHKEYGSTQKAEAARNFLEWCLTDGQKDCEALGYVRLPPALAQRAVAEVRKIR
ncbi:MAG: phosphate ABC transporter substrate-binding protein PstS [Gemmataceae bacterium]|nr:phosphate ABC transporter substrate-binding protein PstS [Gemmataceae bacterium]